MTPEEKILLARTPVLNIETLYAWIDPTDGIVATISDVGLIPLVTSETRLLPDMRHRAQLIARMSGRPLELRVFQFSEVKDRVTP